MRQPNLDMTADYGENEWWNGIARRKSCTGPGAGAGNCLRRDFNASVEPKETPSTPTDRSSLQVTMGRFVVVHENVYVKGDKKKIQCHYQFCWYRG